MYDHGVWVERINDEGITDRRLSRFQSVGGPLPARKPAGLAVVPAPLDRSGRTVREPIAVVAGSAILPRVPTIQSTRHVL